MSILCQSTNLQKSLQLAKQGLPLEDTQKLSSLGFKTDLNTGYMSPF